MILYLFIFFLLLSSCLADLAGNWPELDIPPPIQKEFTDLVDLSKVSKASINAGDLYEDCGTDEYCYWPCTGCLRKNDVNKCSNIGDWGLTFDDGPSNYTSDLIDYLDSKGIKVTFFVVGSRVVEKPEILRKAVKSGHQIGIHTWSHPYLTTQSNEQVIAELQWTAKAIKKATGLVPKYMRPPYGDFDDRIRDICSQLGYTVTIWDRDSQDWMIGGYSDFDVNWVTSNFTQWVKEPSSTGHISLEHDIHKESAAQATKAVPILTGANFNIKPVAECLGDDSPYLNKPNNKPSYHLTETSTPTPTSTLKSTDTSRSPSLSPSAAASSGLTRPSPVSSSSKSINYNNWLTILGLMSLILFHN